MKTKISLLLITLLIFQSVISAAVVVNSVDKKVTSYVLEFGESDNLDSIGLITESKDFSKGSHIKISSIDVDVSNVELLKTKEDYDFFKIKDAYTSGSAGEPTSYMLVKTIILEQNIKITGVKLVDGSFVVIDKNINLAPRKKPFIWHESTDNNNRFIKNDDLYNKNQWFPKKTVSYISGRDQENTILYLQFYPIQFNPKKQKAILINHAEFEINFIIEKSEVVDTKPLSLDVENVIITTSAFKSQAERLEQIHESMENIPTEVVTTEWIESNYDLAEETDSDGFAKKIFKPLSLRKSYKYNTARKIISYFRDTSAHPNLKSITIFGDADIIPPSYYFALPFGLFYDEWFPSDLYYASPDYDLIMNYELGRLPVGNIDEASTIINKIENWEINLDYDWFSNIQLLGGSPFNQLLLNGEISCLYPINKDYLSGLNINKNFLTNDKLNVDTFLPYFCNGDTGIIFHIDHGAGTIINVGDEEISTNDIFSLPECEKNPIVISISCYTAQYDYELIYGPLIKLFYKMINGLSLTDCFAESLLFSKAGSIAYWGGTQTNIGIVETIFDDTGEVVYDEPEYMMRMLINILKAYSEEIVNMGEMSNYALQEYIQTLDSSDFFEMKTLYAFVFLGDPVLAWPVQKESIFNEEIEFDIDPKPNPSINNYNLPTYDIKITKSISISINESSTDVNFSIFKIHPPYPVKTEKLLSETISPPYSFELELAPDTNYLIIGESSDSKETRIYFTTFQKKDIPVQ